MAGMHAWQTHDSRTVYENAWIRVREDAVTTPGGGRGIYGVVEVRHPAVFVVPVTDADEVVLVEVERYTTGELSLEVPAGGSDGEVVEVAARRELREETGLDAEEWQHLGAVHSLNGVAHAPGHVLLARGLRPATEGHAQQEEGIARLRRVPWPELMELVQAGAITDNETLGALLHAAVALGRVS